MVLRLEWGSSSVSSPVCAGFGIVGWVVVVEVASSPSTSPMLVMGWGKREDWQRTIIDRTNRRAVIIMSLAGALLNGAGVGTLLAFSFNLTQLCH